MKPTMDIIYDAIRDLEATVAVLKLTTRSPEDNRRERLLGEAATKCHDIGIKLALTSLELELGLRASKPVDLRYLSGGIDYAGRGD